MERKKGAAPLPLPPFEGGEGRGEEGRPDYTKELPKKYFPSCAASGLAYIVS